MLPAGSVVSDKHTLLWGYYVCDKPIKAPQFAK